MEGEEGEGLRLSKRFSDKAGPGEVDYKTKSGTAWSHSYLNQKPWHPLSYPNQRRKWIAEQTHAQRERRAEEVSREYAQEQEFFRQTALVSKKEKEKMEMMKAVSFMYVRPPGYNAESAKAAEIADESKRHESNIPSSDHTAVGTSGERAPEPSAARDHLGVEKKKPRPKDVFGRPLPTEEEFEILKNAPRMETGVPARVKPFGVEVRNVKCLRCGNYGHQSGDRECPLKDAIMPNEQSRLKRDDPLTAITAHTDPSEPLKWELKQKPGISPPRGGFEPDDPNQQIVAEDIFDEYGGFLGGDGIPNLLTKFSSKPRRKKFSSRKNEEKLHAFSSSRKSKYSKENETLSSLDEERKPRSKKQQKMKKRRNHSQSSLSDESDFDGHHRGRRKHSSRNKQRGDDSSYSSEDSDSEEKKDGLSTNRKSKYSRENETLSPSVDERKPRNEKRHKMKKRRNHSLSGPLHASDFDGHHRGRRKHSSRNKQRGNDSSYSSEDSDSGTQEQSGSRRSKRFYSSKGPESDQCRKTKRKRRECSNSSEDSAAEKHLGRDKDRFKHFVSSEQIHEVSQRGSERRGKTYYSSKTVDHYRGHKSRY